MRSGARWVQLRVPPQSHIARRDGDGSRHAVVSNVDWALLVMGLDDDFNLRRLERYLTLVYASGIAPIVVLTKADIAAADPELRDERLAALGKRIPGTVQTVVVDATDPASAARFAHVACGGQTLVLLGSSGAGKSTLTNTLIGSAVQDTGAVREHDSRGMHTTTARSLHLLPGGACVIDTPGLRTLRPDIDEATLAASFGDVETLAGAVPLPRLHARRRAGLRGARRRRSGPAAQFPQAAARDPARLDDLGRAAPAALGLEVARQGGAGADEDEARRRLTRRAGRNVAAGRRQPAAPCISPEARTCTPGSPRAVAATRAAATSAAAIGRTARGTTQLSGRAKRVASASIGRAGWPSASRSPSRSEGRATVTVA